jgi:hypothetical protein
LEINNSNKKIMDLHLNKKIVEELDSYVSLSSQLEYCHDQSSWGLKSFENLLNSNIEHQKLESWKRLEKHFSNILLSNESLTENTEFISAFENRSNNNNNRTTLNQTPKKANSKTPSKSNILKQTSTRKSGKKSKVLEEKQEQMELDQSEHITVPSPKSINGIFILLSSFYFIFCTLCFILCYFILFL